MAQFRRGFATTFGPSLLQAQQQAGKLAETRQKQKLEFEQESKLGKIIKDLDLPGADIIGTALEENRVSTSQALSLSSAMAKGQPSPLDLAVAQSLGIDLSGLLGRPSGRIGAALDLETRVSVPGIRETALEQQRLAAPFQIKQIKLGPVTLEPKLTAEEKRAETIERGRGKGIEEAFKQAEGIKRAAKKLGSITRQFNEALPAKGKTALEARISGTLALIGAKTGFRENPKLFALQATAKLQLRAILRDMGEGARLSDQDITQNIAVIEQAGLNFKERQALVQSFLQTAVDSMDDATLDVLREDPSSVELMNEFGVKLFEDSLTQNIEQEIPQFDSIEEANAANLPVGTSIMVVNPSTGKLQRAVIE